jgi:hypothetical protein
LLPVSDEAYETGLEEKPISLASLLRLENQEYSSFAGRVLAARNFHRTLDHIGQTFSDEERMDIRAGQYWKQHREIDNDLSAMLALLPNKIQLPRNFRSPNAIFVNVSLQTSIIYLHRSVFSSLGQLELPEYISRQSKSRLLPAATEIISIFRMAPSLYAALYNPLMVFSAYMSALVFLDDLKEGHNHQSEDNLEFLLRIMVAFGKTNPITRALAVQLASDMKQRGCHSSIAERVRRPPFFPLNLPIPPAEPLLTTATDKKSASRPSLGPTPLSE